MTMVRRFFLTSALLSLSVVSCDRDQPLDPAFQVAATGGSGGVKAPSNVEVVALSAIQIGASWQDNSTNETGFEVWRSLSGPGGPFTKLAGTGANVTSYSDAGLTASTEYCYKARAFRNYDGKTSYSDFSNTACATTLAPPVPTAPSAANAAPSNSSAVDVTWTDNSANEDGFRVERSLDGAASWATVSTTAANVTSLQDGGRESEQLVCYHVIAFNAGGDSRASNTDCATPPVAPSNLTTTGVDGPAIDLTWTDNSAVEDGYEVQRSTDGVTFGHLTDLPASSTSYRDHVVIGNKTYFYMVRAKKDGGYSSFSNSVSVAAPITPPSATNGQIAFESNRDGGFAIYVMNPDGSGVTLLTDPAFHSADPSWSPDGTRIVFFGAQCSYFGIFVMNGDGSSSTPLTSCEGTDRFPAWSPDGLHIAFASTRDAMCADVCFDDIYVMNADGTDVRRLTDSPGEDWLPTWSPDGTRIAFSSDRGGTYPALDIYVMNADGSGLRQLTHDAAFSVSPAWSPDGSKIAFSSDRDGLNEIWVMNADGTGLTRLTDDGKSNGDPAWSPDGTRIAFRRGAAIAVMNADGTGLVNLTDGSSEDGDPSWGGAVDASANASGLVAGTGALAGGRSVSARPAPIRARARGADSQRLPLGVSASAYSRGSGRIALPPRH